MFGLSFSELLVIMLIALVFLGPKRLPEVARQLGRAVAMFRHALDDIKQSVDAPRLEVQREIKTTMSTPPSITDNTTSDASAANSK